MSTAKKLHILVGMSPITAFELLFFAVFGQTTYEDLTVKGVDNKDIRPPWTANLFKIIFGIYMLVSVVVLINLLIAMMSDTYQRIQAALAVSSQLKLAKSPIHAFELLFFAVFGQTLPGQLKANERNNGGQPQWTDVMFKAVFGVYMLVSVVVLINLLIAMMSDTYQRIQAQSDIEWKFGLSKLIRSMHRTTTAPAPINLVTTWLCYFIAVCKAHLRQRKRPSLTRMMSIQRSQLSARSKAGAKWLTKVKKGSTTQIAPKDSVAFAHFSPLGSQLSFVSVMTRIENVADWESIAKKYRALIGETEEVANENNEEEQTEEGEEGAVAASVYAGAADV